MTSVFDVAIIGAGPAGCSCAIWLKQLGFNPLLIDRQPQCGGIQLQNAYPNTWIASSANVSGKDIAAIMHKNVTDLNIALHLEAQALHAVQKGQVFETEIIKAGRKQKFLSRFMVLAGGIIPKSGGFTERENLFIGSTPRLAAAGLKGKSVALLGGGDNAFENYLFARQGGAAHVNIFSRSKPRAQLNFINKVPEKDVFIGPFACDPEKNTVNGRHFDCIIVMYGYEVSRESLLGLDVSRSDSGYLSTDAQCRTSLVGVFAIGEITNRTHPSCVTAMADGVIAAKAIQARLEKERM